MNIKTLSIAAAALLTVSLSSCSPRFTDFTIVSSKNIELNMNKAAGKKVYGSSIPFLYINIDLKDAINEALLSAGPEYDLLVDGVIKSHTYLFGGGYIVEGIAVNTSTLRAELGEEGFQQWLRGQNNVIDPNNVLLAQK